MQTNENGKKMKQKWRKMEKGREMSLRKRMSDAFEDSRQEEKEDSAHRSATVSRLSKIRRQRNPLLHRGLDARQSPVRERKQSGESKSNRTGYHKIIMVFFQNPPEYLLGDAKQASTC